MKNKKHCDVKSIIATPRQIVRIMDISDLENIDASINAYKRTVDDLNAQILRLEAIRAMYAHNKKQAKKPVKKNLRNKAEYNCH
jgi:hypothetical protein